MIFSFAAKSLLSMLR